jgi:hypothetical protein
MSGFIFGLGLFIFVTIVTRLVIHYLTNRPDPAPLHSTQELVDEMEEAFVDRSSVSFDLTAQMVRPFFSRLREAVAIGFTERQMRTLVKRIESQIPLEMQVASYAVEASGVPSDMEFQWCRLEDGITRLAIAATDDILAVAKAAFQTVSSR